MLKSGATPFLMLSKISRSVEPLIPHVVRPGSASQESGRCPACLRGFRLQPEGAEVTSRKSQMVDAGFRRKAVGASGAFRRRPTRVPIVARGTNPVPSRGSQFVRVHLRLRRPGVRRAGVHGPPGGPQGSALRDFFTGVASLRYLDLTVAVTDPHEELRITAAAVVR
jgi:hypothetical protein